MLPFKSKPTKNLIWPGNMSHIFQLVGENFFCSCTVCLGKCLCKCPFPRFISEKFLKSAVEMQWKKCLLRKEPCSVVASQLWLFLFSRAWAAVRTGQGVVPTQPWCLVAKVPPRGQMLNAYSEMCASCWQKSLIVLHRRAGAVLRVKKIHLPLFFIKGCKEGEELTAFKFQTLHSERVGWGNED